MNVKNRKCIRFVGEDLDVAALSDARNTYVQVSDIALFNLEDRFDFIKKATPLLFPVFLSKR